MGRKKPLPQRGVSSEVERAALFKLMTAPCQSSECAFKHDGQPLCDLSAEKRPDYENWCKDLLQFAADPNSSKPSDALTALRRLREDQVPLPCTIQAIRDFVYYDMKSKDVIFEVQKCKTATGKSSGRVRTLSEKCEELGATQIAELDSYTKRVSSFGLLEEKQNLVSLIKRAVSALQEIYAYELKRLDEMNGDTFSWAQALHVEFLLPPHSTSTGNRYWKEVAALMTEAKRAWNQGTNRIPGQSRTYSVVALQKLWERFTENERQTFRKALSDKVPDFFDRLYELDEETVRKCFAAAHCFKPSAKADEIMRVASSVLNGKIEFRPENNDVGFPGSGDCHAPGSSQ
jgi:hypothetical protein